MSTTLAAPPRARRWGRLILAALLGVAVSVATDLAIKAFLLRGIADTYSEAQAYSAGSTIVALFIGAGATYVVAKLRGVKGYLGALGLTFVAQIVVGVLLVLLLVQAAPTVDAKQDKVYVCHAAGRDGTTKYVTLHVPATDTGYPKGHFTEGGTQAAGHEDDYLGECDEPEPTATPTQRPTPPPTSTPAPTATPTSSPSSTPPPTPTPDPTDPPEVPTCDIPEGCGPVVTDPPAAPRPAVPTLPPTDTVG